MPRVIVEVVGMSKEDADRWPGEMEFPVTPLAGQRIVLSDDTSGWVQATYWMAQDAQSIYQELVAVIGVHPPRGLVSTVKWAAEQEQAEQN